MTPENSLIDNLIVLLEEYLEETSLEIKDKLVIVNALDKIVYQRELAQLKAQGLTIESLKVASERLQKKSQSAFDNLES